MLFIHTWEKVLSGEKTQTRRIVKPGDYLVNTGFAVCRNTGQRERIDERGNWDVKHIPVYEIGKQYAVQPGRGKAAVGRIQITNIRREDVRYISDADVKAEGFDGLGFDIRYFNFMQTWAGMHDPAFVFWYDPRIVDYMWYTSKRQMNQGQSETGAWEHLVAAIRARPAQRYDAWVLEFKLVKDSE